MKLLALPELGRIVEVVRGRDSGLMAVVIGHDPDRFVRIVDGDVRKVDRPKKKNVAHVRSHPHIAEDIAEALRMGQKVTNANIRYALRRFHEGMQQTGSNVTKEGELPNGEG